MQDRVPLYPGRVKLVPVSGQENTYDMTRVDQPSEEGTPLNKNSLLKDATAALFGLGADAVPDDVLKKIKTLISTAQGSADISLKFVTGSYIGSWGNGISSKNSITFARKPLIVIIAKDNEPSPSYFMFVRPSQIYSGFWNSGGGASQMYCEWGEKNLTWYSTIGSLQQGNDGYLYNYIALCE